MSKTFDIAATTIIALGCLVLALVIFAVQLVCLPFVWVSKNVGKLVP